MSHIKIINCLVVRSWLENSTLPNLQHFYHLYIREVQYLNAHCCRNSGNDFRFPDIASYTFRFRLIFVCISSVVSFRVDILRNEKRNQMQLDVRDPTFINCVPGRIITRSLDIRDPTLKNKTEKRPKSFPLSLHCCLNLLDEC